jgi:hypothetical protein
LVSDYRISLDRTSDVLAIRAQAFRNLVVSFVVIGVSSVGGAVGVLNLRPVSALLLLVPAYGTFLWRDSWVLDRWRAQLGEAWASRRIDFAAFRHAVNANPSLPQGTVQAMLATLPEVGDLTSEQAVEPGTRQAVLSALRAGDDSHTDALACRAAAHGIVAVAVVASILFRAWAPLLALGLVSGPMVVCAWRRRWRMTGAVDELQRLRERSDFDSERYRTILGSLDWQDLRARYRDHLTALH